MAGGPGEKALVDAVTFSEIRLFSRILEHLTYLDQKGLLKVILDAFERVAVFYIRGKPCCEFMMRDFFSKFYLWQKEYEATSPYAIDEMKKWAHQQVF